MKQNGLAPILVVLLIALAVGGYFIYQKQPKPVSISQPSPSPVTTPTASDKTVYTEASRSANWKTYTNIKYGYSFKYPADKMEVDTGSSVPYVLYIRAIGGNTQNTQQTGFYHIQVTAHPEVLTVDEYINLFKRSPEEKDMIKNQLKTTINDYPAVITTYKSSADDSGRWGDRDIEKKYYIYSPSRGIDFTTVGALGVKNTDHTVLDKIVSTFKFINRPY